MFQIDVLQNLIPQPRIMASRAVIYAADGVTPLVVIVEWQPGDYFVSKAGDSDFVQTLRNLGIDRSVTVEQFTPTPLSDFSFKK